ncbi:hypothetical protein [Arthrobacter sp. Bz4]|uniref:hypothetical protein n=1 Tax=Arthrobacter sp. Bz4 TaxID=2171979 RepID=UPI000D51F26D|nr:hypothetical protein [Arthrobacter sp. Bz4]PVE14826.1 hypothetical protein DDA93_15560 [Arthrobacter sp. Bz4]
MFRVAVVQNQSESQRSGYANVSRNLSENMPRDRFEFCLFDASNLYRLFTINGDDALDTFDGLFISTNVTSDRLALAILNSGAPLIAEFLSRGRGIFVSYQKKMSYTPGDDPIEISFLPERYHVRMMERPFLETDSGLGDIDFAETPACMNTAAYLLISSPNEITPQSVKTHCLENDFKAHLYRSTIRPLNSSVFDAVFHDPSYADDYGVRDLLLVNRSAEAGERVVVSTIAIDWQLNLRILENILEYIAAGVPRLAFIDSPRGDSDIDFIQSTAGLDGIPSREYKDLSVPSRRLRGIHDVYVLSSHWSAEDVAEFWARISTPRTLAFREASEFRRLYHLGEHSTQSLTRYANYTSLDAIINEAVLWMEHQFNGGFWEGGFWNSHDVLIALDSLRVNIASFLPGVLADVRGHLRNGAYDSVMGPTCGLMVMLNRFTPRYGEILESEGFTSDVRFSVGEWICSNAPTQSEIARQVASQAIFSPGGEDVVAALRKSRLSDEATALARVVRQSDYTSTARVSGYTNLDLARLLEMGGASETIDESARAHVHEVLVARQQPDSGLWGSTAESAAVLSALLGSEHEQGTAVYEAILKGVDALRGRFDQATASWNSNLQETAACVRALGLFNERLDLAAQDVLETIELQRLASNRAMTVGQARVDLAALFDREERHVRELMQLRDTVKVQGSNLAEATSAASRSSKQSIRFRQATVASLTVLVGVVLSLLITEPNALLSLLGAASLLGLALGALIAVPITIWLTPRTATSGRGPAPEGEVSREQRNI